MMMTVRPLTIRAHVVLDYPLAFIVQRTRRLVEDQDARIGDQRARYRDTLTLPTRQAVAALVRRRCRRLPAAQE